ncbi:hypothetical protein TRVA0_045S00870 [Trichomonascus vanleenenianus]|uniref:uncharacterized protein n=1 Tax=Trichomonascus vanleenenianus TaxID=2268995 RepID=UPI003ECA4367
MDNSSELLNEDDLFDQLSSSPSINEEEIDFQYVYALRTFIATEEGQANAQKGDAMILLNDTNSYWWLVRLVKNSSVGFLPAEYVETPWERLARLNKHRNGEISLPASHIAASASKSLGKMFRSNRKKAKPKTVTFTTTLTYVSASEYDYSEDEADGEYEDEEEEQEQEQEQDDNNTNDGNELTNDTSNDYSTKPLNTNHNAPGDRIISIKERVGSYLADDSDDDGYAPPAPTITTNNAPAPLVINKVRDKPESSSEDAFDKAIRETEAASKEEKKKKSKFFFKRKDKNIQGEDLGATLLAEAEAQAAGVDPEEEKQARRRSLLRAKGSVEQIQTLKKIDSNASVELIPSPNSAAESGFNLFKRKPKKEERVPTPPSNSRGRPSLDTKPPSLDARRPSVDTKRPSFDTKRPDIVNNNNNNQSINHNQSSNAPLPNNRAPPFPGQQYPPDANREKPRDPRKGPLSPSSRMRSELERLSPEMRMRLKQNIHSNSSSPEPQSTPNFGPNNPPIRPGYPQSPHPLYSQKHGQVPPTGQGQRNASFEHSYPFPVTPKLRDSSLQSIGASSIQSESNFQVVPGAVSSHPIPQRLAPGQRPMAPLQPPQRYHKPDHRRQSVPVDQLHGEDEEWTRESMWDTKRKSAADLVDWYSVEKPQALKLDTSFGSDSSTSDLNSQTPKLVPQPHDLDDDDDHEFQSRDSGETVKPIDGDGSAVSAIFLEKPILPLSVSSDNLKAGSKKLVSVIDSEVEVTASRTITPPQRDHAYHHSSGGESLKPRDNNAFRPNSVNSDRCHSESTSGSAHQTPTTITTISERSHSSVSTSSPPFLGEDADESTSEQDETPLLLAHSPNGTRQEPINYWNGSTSSLSLTSDKTLQMSLKQTVMMEEKLAKAPIVERKPVPGPPQQQRLKMSNLNDLHPDIVPIFKDTSDRLGVLSSKLDELLKNYR